MEADVWNLTSVWGEEAGLVSQQPKLLLPTGNVRSNLKLLPVFAADPVAHPTRPHSIYTYKCSICYTVDFSLHSLTEFAYVYSLSGRQTGEWVLCSPIRAVTSFS
ncbi:unnamed protein product [Cercospora beticola]|nr:unnamed protein product [Cercospora beticola]